MTAKTKIEAYNLWGPFTTHDQPADPCYVDVQDARSGFMLARVYGVGASEAMDAAREYVRARESFGPCVQALRLALALHDDPLARATYTPSGTTTKRSYGGDLGPLFDPKAAEQIRGALADLDALP